ncbi:hypothetical protein A9P79_28815 (plasmid) [Cupriavidus taiwanensis]|nr:hypothetical protein A9P79_28815 [Cupriavidus taiwanensis]
MSIAAGLKRCFERIAAAAHVSLATSTRPVKHPERLGKEFARARESKCRDQAMPVCELFKPAVGQKGPHQQVRQLHWLTVCAAEFVGLSFRGQPVGVVTHDRHEQFA